MINLREEMYFHSTGTRKGYKGLKNEKVVSEFHLADDSGAVAHTYWPK